VALLLAGHIYLRYIYQMQHVDGGIEKAALKRLCKKGLLVHMLKWVPQHESLSRLLELRPLLLNETAKAAHLNGV